MGSKLSMYFVLVITRDFNRAIAAFVTTGRFDEASFYNNYVRECTRVTGVPAIIGASGYPSVRKEARGEKKKERNDFICRRNVKEASDEEEVFRIVANRTT